MAIVKTVTLGPFLGENNRLPRTSLNTVVDRTRVAYLAATDNVDVDQSRTLKSGRGQTLFQPLADGHSLTCLAGKMLFADDDTLYRVTSFAPLTTTTVCAVAGKVSFEDINGEIFFTDGDSLRCLQADNTVRKVGLPVPGTLSLAATAGALPAGDYLVAVTWFNGAEEGAASPVANITLATAGGITVTLPTAPTEATHVGIYLSTPNGTVLRLHSVIAPASSATLTAEATGRECRTLGRWPMMPGSLITHIPGRLLTAEGNRLYISDAYNFAMLPPVKGYVEFPAEITVIAGNTNGVYVVADKTYWLINPGTEQMDMNPVFNYGAVKFSQSKHPTEKQVVWLSAKGVVIGDESGQVKNITEDTLKLDLSGTGASLYLYEDNRIIATNG